MREEASEELFSSEVDPARIKPSAKNIEAMQEIKEMT